MSPGRPPKEPPAVDVTSKALAEVSTVELSKIPFLSVASSRGLSRLAQKTRLVAFSAGDTIFNEGDPPLELFVIRSGEIRISMLTPTGEEEERRLLREGKLLGELGILGGHERTATAEAVTDTELWAIDREAFLEIYSNEPAVAIEVASTLAPYLLDNEVVAEDLLFLDLPGRVAKRLLSFLEKDGKNVHEVVASENLSRDQVGGALRNIGRGRQTDQTLAQIYSQLPDLAMMAGGTREKVTRILIEYERRGYLLNTEGNLILIDLDALRQIARRGASG